MDDITLTLEEALEELVSAEDFLEFFDVPFEPSVVHVNRLHILQRFHDYMAKQAPNLPPDEEQQRGIYRLWLQRAYQDFVESNSITEKVFAVFQNQAKPDGGFSSFVSLDKVFKE
ncbi:MAG: nitrogen fixation protein NifW [Dechloromonas sp.]|nr:MAG: nitrogen fixation protein NifW [Dechloromonas sp.]